MAADVLVFPSLSALENVRVALQRPLGSSFRSWRSDRCREELDERAVGIRSRWSMRRLLSTRDVADYVLFLASEKASNVTGQAVVVDGGHTAQ
jgi:NAD(P)-dependent dehydrogenase (short-subunit alcohol dehydrogenase family)